MVDISIDKLLETTDNKFVLVNAAALRTKQIAGGSLPYIDEFDPTNPIITALREISLQKIKFREVAAETSKEKEKTEESPKRESVLERLSKGSKKKQSKKKA